MQQLDRFREKLALTLHKIMFLKQKKVKTLKQKMKAFYQKCTLFIQKYYKQKERNKEKIVTTKKNTCLVKYEIKKNHVYLGIVICIQLRFSGLQTQLKAEPRGQVDLCLINILIKWS